jgi:tetratricopeptide (TPR) repeat protein
MLKRIVLLVVILAAGLLAYFLRFSPSARKALHFSRAGAFFEAAEFDKAKLEYLNVLQRDPAHALAAERLGAIWHLQGVPLQAVPFLLRVKEVAPENLENRRKLALDCFALVEFDRAYKEAEGILDQSSEDQTGWTILADSSLGEPQLDAVEARLEKAENKTRRR